MKKEIEIVIFEKGWSDFFADIFSDTKYDYKKYLLKLHLWEQKFQDEMIKLWIVLSFKKYWHDIYGSLAFWLETEKWLSEKTKTEIKDWIKVFLNNFYNTAPFLNNTKRLKKDESQFSKIGCGIIEFSTNPFYLYKENSPIQNFSLLLKMIYELFYFDILNTDKKQTIFIENPILDDLEKEVDIPPWLEWTGLEKNEIKKVEKQKLEKLSLEDMWGNKSLKIEIGKLISFYKNRDHFKKWNIEPPRWVLLYGPPGTGKTLTAKIIANEIGVNFYTLSSSDIMIKWIGESARNVKDFFKNIQTPCIVFMDEIDALVPDRDGDRSGSNLHEQGVQVINTLLQEIDGFWQKKDILFIGATNRIDAIDPALLRSGRLDYKIFVDYPDLEARKEIWWIYLKKAKAKTNYDFLDEHVDLDVLAKKTDKFTGSDIAEVVRRLLSDYAIGSLVSSKVTNIIWWETTLKWLLYIISKFKDEKIFNHDIVPLKPETRLSDIWGSKILKEELTKIINQYKNKELFEEFWVKPPRWILLYGPPGTGKTLAAKALAWEIWEIFYSIKATDFLSQWTNASVENLDKIFQSFESPSVVFIDEIDAIAKNRDKNWHISEEDIKVLNTFLQYIDWFDDKKDILFIGATNRIEALDKAILRAGRFDTKVLVDFPDEEARIEIWRIYIEKSKTKSKKQNIFENNIDYKLLATESEKMTWADIAEIVRRVKEQFAMNETKKDQKSKNTLSRLIDMSEILEVLKKYRDENQVVKKDEKRIGFNL